MPRLPEPKQIYILIRMGCAAISAGAWQLIGGLQTTTLRSAPTHLVGAPLENFYRGGKFASIY